MTEPTEDLPEPVDSPEYPPEPPRPSHIVALDAALTAAIAEAKLKDQEVMDFLDDHILILRQYSELLKARARQHDAMHQTYRAISSLGFAPLENLDGMGYNSAADEENAYARATA